VKPPGPKGHFLVGNLPDFGRDILGFFSQCASYGDVVSLQMAHWPALFLNHPEHFEHVLVDNHRNFIKHRFFFRHVTEIFGHGLLTNEGAPWLRQRRLMQPAFHRERIAGYAATMSEYAERMLDRWDVENAGERDVHDDFMHLTAEIATRTLFGAELSHDAASGVGAVFSQVIVEIANRFRRPFKVPRWLPIASNRNYARAVAHLDRLIYGFIEQKRAEGMGDDLLSMLLEARDEDGSAMDTRQIRDEAITIFLAGHETTAIALSWTFHLLARHPEIEERLVGELDRSPDPARLPLLTNVIHESMRLFPPAYAIGREALADFELAGYRIRRGTTVYISPWVSHRDPRWFDDPLTFDPDRWNNDLAKRLPRYAYLPFGGGPRLCIGNSFAIMETALIVAAVLRRYRLTQRAERTVTPLPSITLRPKEGMWMEVTRR
jgi:cytochrome P450